MAVYTAADEIFDRCHSKKPYDRPVTKNTFAELYAEDIDTGRILAYGNIVAFCEASIVLDHDLPLKQKTLSWKYLIEDALRIMKRLGFDRLYLFADSPKHAALLKKHFGAQSCTGESLVIFPGEL